MNDELHKIESELKGAASKELDVENLNVAAALATLSTRMLDMLANIHQIHNTVVRLGQNIDTVYASARDEVSKLKGNISELEMRVSDLEALKGRELSDNGS